MLAEVTSEFNKLKIINPIVPEVQKDSQLKRGNINNEITDSKEEGEGVHYDEENP